MNEKQYLSELMKKYDLKFKNNMINLIYSPCGSGKTYYITNNFLFSNDYQVIYVCDTTALQEEMISKYAHELALKLDIEVNDIMIRSKTNKLGIKYHEIEYINNNINLCYTFITYNRFGAMIKNGYMQSLDTMKQFLDLGFNNKQPVIIFDEVHNLFEYQDRHEQRSEADYDPNGNYTIAVNTLLDDLVNKILVIALSATPEQLLYQQNVYDVLANKKDELISYQVKNTLKYHGKLLNLLQSIPHKKVVVYTSGEIPTMNEMVKKIKEQGISCECLFSKNSTKGKLSDEQLELYDTLLKTGTFPYDVLIINSAYETGINIFDSEIDTFIYDAAVRFQRGYIKIQSRGRIRHDIDYIYVRVNQRELKKVDKDHNKLTLETNRRVELLDQVLNQKLTTSEFKSLCEELNFRNPKNNESQTGKKAIEQIELLGYKVDNKRVGKQKITTFIIIK